MKIRISKAGRRAIAGAVAVLGTFRYGKAATNFIWTGTAGDNNWTTVDNWEQANGLQTTYPGNSTNTGANAVIADSYFDNLLGTDYTAPVLPIPNIGVSPSTLEIGILSLGSANTSYGVLTLSSSFSIGTAGTTIEFNAGTGGLNRLASIPEELSGGNYNGTVYPGTTGIQTLLSNLQINANQNWSIGGTSGEVLVDGNLVIPSANTLTKSSNGLIELNANNSGSSLFAGKYVALEGTTLLDNAYALGSGTSTINVSGGSAVYSSSLLTNSGVTFGRNITVAAPTSLTATLGGASNQSSSTWTGNINLVSGVLLTGGASGTTTFSGAISGASYGITKVDFGTIVLNGTNTYGGITNVSTGTLNIGGGTAGGSINASSGLVVGGSTLTLTRTGAIVQTFSATTINPGASAIIDNVSGDTLALKAITRSVGGTVDFTNTGYITTTTSNVNSILGGWATTGGGTGWASSAANAGTAGNITPLPAYTNDTWASGNNTTVTVSNSFNAAQYTTNSLRFNTAAAITLALGPSTTNTITSGGILVTPNVGSNSPAITGGYLQGASGGDLILNQYDTAAPLTISSVIENNGSATGLTKSNPGQVILGASNTYTGGTYVNSGELSAGIASSAFGVNSAVSISAGATLDLSGTGFSQTIGSLAGNGGSVNLGANTLTIGGNGGTTTFAGSISGTGGLTLTGGNLTLSGTSTYSGVTNISGGALTAGASTASGGAGPLGVNAAVILANTAGVSLNLNGFAVSVGSITGGGANGGNINLGTGTLTFGSDNTSPAPFAGIISGSGGLTKVGSGTYTFTGSNTFSGLLDVNAGTVIQGAAGALGNSPGLVLSNTSGVTLNLNNFNTSFSSITGGGSAGGNINIGSATLTVTGAGSPKAFAGAITGTGALVISGSGTLTLTGTASNFSGGTTIQNGTLSFSNIAALGNASSPIVFGGTNYNTTGTLSYTGTVPLTLTNNFATQVSSGATVGGAYIENASTQTLTLSSAATITGNGKVRVGGTGKIVVDALIDTQSNTGVATPTATLVKSETGTAEINNPNNSYDGGTSLQNGILLVDNAGSLGLSNSTISVGASVSNSTSAPTLLTNGSFNVSQSIIVYNISSSGLSTIGASSNQNTSSGFTGQIALERTATLTSGVGSAVNFSGPIQDQGDGYGLNIVGTGTVVLSNTNAYSGITNVASGTLTGTGPAAFGTGNLLVTPTGASPATVNSTYSIASTASVTVNSTSTTAIGTINFYGTTEQIGTLGGNGNVVLANTSGTALTVGNANNSTFTGSISDVNGSGSLIKVNSGTLTLGGAGSFGGGTTVSAGTLIVTNTTGSATGSGPVLVSSGATLGGTGIILGPVTVNGTIAPGAGAGTNTSANILTVGSGSTLQGTTVIDLTSTGGSDEIVFGSNGNGTANLGGTLTVQQTVGFAFSNYQSFNILSFGSVNGSFGTVNLPQLPGNLTWNESTLYSNGIISIGTGVSSGTWTNPAGGTWETAGNWNGSSIANGGGQTATFGDVIGTTAATINLTEPETVGTLSFNGSQGGQYTLTGQTLTLSSGGTSPALISVNAGNQILDTPISLTSAGLNINTASGSSLTLGGTISGRGAITVTTGSTLLVSSNGEVNAALVVDGSVNFANNSGGSGYLVRNVSSLNVSGGSLVLAAGSQPTHQLLEIGTGGLSDTGLIDLANNDLLLQGGGSTGLTQISNLIQQGYASGGTWQGSTGITSSSAAADPTHLTALGVILNQVVLPNGSTGTLYSTFDGATTSKGDVLVKFTYYGDTNLSGAIDGSDYTAIDNGYLNHLTGWANGDFNYDGVVDGSDYTLIDNAFNSQGASLAAEVATPTAQIAGAPGGSAVPEPSTLGLLGIGAVGLLGRRRRKAVPRHR